MQFTSFGASFRALSGASSDVSEEVFVFRPADVGKRAQAPRKTVWGFGSHKYLDNKRKAQRK